MYINLLLITSYFISLGANSHEIWLKMRQNEQRDSRPKTLPSADDEDL